MNPTKYATVRPIDSTLVLLTMINSSFTLLSCVILYYPVFPIFVYVFRKNRDKERVFHKENMRLIYQNMLMYESIIIHILMFASASLYIPISVSIRRTARLRSIIKNKPDRYILYQTIGLAAFKVTSLRVHIFERFEADFAQNGFVLYGNNFDFFTTPVMIQMSYLFSNKRNFDTIKNIFKRNNRTLPSISLGTARTASVDN
ncbi:unnamed protein product [Caenorhabditis nigoni]